MSILYDSIIGPDGLFSQTGLGKWLRENFGRMEAIERRKEMEKKYLIREQARSGKKASAVKIANTMGDAYYNVKTAQETMMKILNGPGEPAQKLKDAIAKKDFDELLGLVELYNKNSQKTDEIIR